MNSSALSSRAIKRVLRDLAEIQKDPIPGLALCMPDINDPFTLHGNIEIKDGIYEGILIHLLIHIPEEYPVKPPAVNIAPGLDFGNEYHHHIYDNPTYGNSICTDLTSNFAGHFSVIDANGKPAKSGWTPAYTLSSVLMQLQVFFADPDMPQHILPSAEKIKSLRNHISQYTLDIRTNNDEDGVKIVTHSSQTPYPPLSNPKSISKNTSSKVSENLKETVENKAYALVKKENSNTSESTISTEHESPLKKTKEEPREEEKEEFFSKEEEKEFAEEPKNKQPKVDKPVTFDWGKPLKRVSKTDTNNNVNTTTTTTNTVVVKVVKEAPKTEQQSSKLPETIPPKPKNNKKNRESDRVAQRGKRSDPNHRNQYESNNARRFEGENNNSNQRRNKEGFRNQGNDSNHAKTYNSRPKRIFEENSNVNNKVRNNVQKREEPEEEEKVHASSSHPIIKAPNYDNLETPNPQNAGEWGNPLKRVDKNNRPKSTKTAVVSVTVTKTQNGYVQTLDSYQSQPMFSVNQQAQASYAQIAQEVEKIKIDSNSIFSQENIYKSTLNQGQQSLSEIKEEISNKLICSVSKTDVFDSSKPVLGYPIDLEKDFYGRLWPTPIMELLSYDSFIFNIQQNFEKLDNYHRVKFTSSFGSQYNYWLPVYIDEAHFERSQQHIFNAIAIIYAGVEGKRENDFNPLMVLKVLPPILVKTAIHFLKGTIHQSIVGIDCYCQLYRLFVKLVELFPEIQEAIDKEVEVFCKREENRHKKVAGDLGEFIIKLSLSSHGLNDPEIVNLVLKEYLARQISWALKKDKGLGLGEKCPNFLERFMAATQVSNQFFLTSLETARLLLDVDVKNDLEIRCGVLSDATMKLFRARLNWIQKNISNDWSTFIDGVGQKSKIYSDQVMTSYVMKAFEASKFKGYLN